jgi:hypothetical protein
MGFDCDILGMFKIPDRYIEDFWLNYKGIFNISDPLKDYIKTILGKI